MMARNWIRAGAAVSAVGAALWWTLTPVGPTPPYPTAAELAALDPMRLPESWTWNGNVSSGGPPDGKNFGLDLHSAVKLWQGDRIEATEAEAMKSALSKACASREFAEALVLVRGRSEDMADMRDRQLVARVNWESAPSGTAGRFMQTFEVFYAFSGGVCGAVQPKGLIESPYLDEGSVRRWFFY